MKPSNKPATISPDDHHAEPNELELAIDSRYRSREWLAQVDFWEGVKEFILKRIPSSSRPVDQLY